MKKQIFLAATLAAISLGASGLVLAKDFNLQQTTSGTSKKQTDAEKKAEKAKREEAKKEAEKARKESKATAKNADQTTKKKHKKFLGIF